MPNQIIIATPDPRDINEVVVEGNLSGSWMELGIGPIVEIPGEIYELEITTPVDPGTQVRFQYNVIDGGEISPFSSYSCIGEVEFVPEPGTSLAMIFCAAFVQITRRLK